jgi:hypothetical protein
VSNGRNWSVHQNSLQGALEAWYATNPDSDAVQRVNDWLEQRLAKNPLTSGTEDPDHLGIMEGRVPGTNVGVTFVPNTDEMRVYVVAIETVG